MGADELKLHDVVALMAALPEEGLRQGQMGTIIDVYEPGVYEVEFADNQGQTYASLTLAAAQLLPLHSEPMKAVP
ncbi:MAG TPA: DUF4926 domain-containing protein [Phycisphaerae bacterium]|nr:DUF4926 domain-containing protein [Phycisphaerae bacterium]